MYILALAFFAPTLSLGALGLWFTLRYLHPFLRELSAAPWSRGLMCRVLFAGVVNAESEQVAQLQRIRGTYAGLIGLMMLIAAFFMGLGAVVFFGVLLGLNFLMARPFDVAEANK
ncbi:hypothetical protein [Tropicibacter sp. Alg240-R139]|uniref:hypothetical protein n=1 Tax=Tropicibacter sp. Alg240-R139 TaxID=2305991 RepID=UPI0019676074|nr:hypothetical protein [Tropicibacter sp. Alg240-R139]